VIKRPSLALLIVDAVPPARRVRTLPRPIPHAVFKSIATAKFGLDYD
jgi:hypothetical protein